MCTLKTHLLKMQKTSLKDSTVNFFFKMNDPLDKIDQKTLPLKFRLLCTYD